MALALHVGMALVNYFITATELIETAFVSESVCMIALVIAVVAVLRLHKKKNIFGMNAINMK